MFRVSVKADPKENDNGRNFLHGRFDAVALFAWAQHHTTGLFVGSPVENGGCVVRCGWDVAAGAYMTAVGEDRSCGGWVVLPRCSSHRRTFVRGSSPLVIFSESRVQKILINRRGTPCVKKTAVRRPDQNHRPSLFPLFLQTSELTSNFNCI